MLQPGAVIVSGFAALAAAKGGRLHRAAGTSPSICGARRASPLAHVLCPVLRRAFFLIGQQKVMPAGLRGSPLLLVPALAPLVPMAFWLMRVRIGNRFKDKAIQDVSTIPAGPVAKPGPI